MYAIQRTYEQRIFYVCKLQDLRANFAHVCNLKELEKQWPALAPPRQASAGQASVSGGPETLRAPIDNT